MKKQNDVQKQKIIFLLFLITFRNIFLENVIHSKNLFMQEREESFVSLYKSSKL
jgi:hypothetical protein